MNVAFPLLPLRTSKQMLILHKIISFLRDLD